MTRPHPAVRGYGSRPPEDDGPEPTGKLTGKELRA